MFDTKRSHGLALSAVSALAITGLTFIPSSALAAPGDAVVMISQLGGKASVRPDGKDLNPTQTVDLVAERLDPDATISFELNGDPEATADTTNWMAIDSQVLVTAGFATASWNPGVYVGSTVSLRAVATIDGEATYSTVNGVTISGAPAAGAAAPHSVSVSDTSTGYFVQPYAGSGRTATKLVVDGTTSATEGTVGLSWWRTSDSTFQGATDAALAPGTGKTFDGSTMTEYPIGLVHEALDITGYDAEASDDVIAVRGVRDSDGVTPIQVYNQTVGAVEAFVPTESATREVPVDVRVTDAQGSQGLVAGAEVRRLSDQSLVGYTDADGLVGVTLEAGSSETYYVNTTDTDAYEPDVDVTSGAVTAPVFTPVVTDVVPVFADGTTFDDDEYGTGDLALQLVDQEGDPIKTAGEELTYSVHAKDAVDPEQTTAETDADGRVVVPFDPAGADGVSVLDYSSPASVGGDPKEPVEFTAGDSTLALAADGAGSATSGGQITYTGNLSLAGEPLAGRTIDLTYARGTEAAPGTAADAGIVVGDTRVLTTTATTDEDGQFTVTVADPIETSNPGETGTLTATAAAAEETASVTVTFDAGAVGPAPAPAPTPVTAPAKVKLMLSGSSKGRAADKLKVASAKTAAGQRVRVYAKTGKGGWKVVKTVRLDRAGRAALKLKDRNGTKKTSYRVRLIATASVTASTSNVKRLR
jgi:hypothetical protein